MLLLLTSFHVDTEFTSALQNLPYKSLSIYRFVHDLLTTVFSLFYTNTRAIFKLYRNYTFLSHGIQLHIFAFSGQVSLLNPIDKLLQYLHFQITPYKFDKDFLYEPLIMPFYKSSLMGFYIHDNWLNCVQRLVSIIYTKFYHFYGSLVSLFGDNVIFEVFSNNFCMWLFDKLFYLHADHMAVSIYLFCIHLYFITKTNVLEMIATTTGAYRSLA